MQDFYNINSLKKPVNLTINSDLLRVAKEFKINLSSALEKALVQSLTAKQRDKWIEDNKEAISSYNDRVETGGVFSNGLRSF
ncbi:MAG: type II toxin-antitoxin system CcdA family antitoxin [Thermodesulfobacteriota bacterium]